MESVAQVRRIIVQILFKFLFLSFISEPKPEPCKETCGSPSYKGDNYCDDDNNNCGCNYDGGDCCGSKVNKTYCKECKCKQ